VKKVITTFFAILFLSGCINTFVKKDWEHKDYYIAANPGDNVKTLYLGLPDGAGIDRVKNITSITVVGDFILSESESDTKEGSQQYWILNMEHDNESFSADEIVRGPFEKEEFLELLKEYNIMELDWKIIK
jgi:hypothetical protein